jgi:hypothetical protein
LETNPGRPKLTQKKKTKKKQKNISCFEELDVLSGVLDACTGPWKYFMLI